VRPVAGAPTERGASSGVAERRVPQRARRRVLRRQGVRDRFEPALDRVPLIPAGDGLMGSPRFSEEATTPKYAASAAWAPG
jgi:hypothetical protein